ncbi:hypothetical protein QQZ08_007320 [Neonectria magnoliae]|uniref:SET domain-containing protein n=1 Tax=Neonectria magnoliae TaxID=2732573 RepID=A0ABR1HZB9_9HYPO
MDHSQVDMSNTSSGLEQNWDAIAINSIKGRGVGCFAKKDFPPRHPIIVVKPAISCVHWRQRGGRKTIGDEWARLNPATRGLIRHYFKQLKSIPDTAELTPKHRKELEKFVEDYAFWDTTRTNAHIYHIASHINHACPSCANAEQWTNSEEPHQITVTLVRRVKQGEEIFINYNKGRMPFGCAVCGRRRPKATIDGDDSDESSRQRLETMLDATRRGWNKLRERGKSFGQRVFHGRSKKDKGCQVTDPATVLDPAPFFDPAPLPDPAPVPNPASVQDAPVPDPTPVPDPVSVTDPAPVLDPAPVPDSAPVLDPAPIPDSATVPDPVSVQDAPVPDPTPT